MSKATTMQTLFLVCGFAIAVAGMVSPASADPQQFTIGGAAVNLVLPDGHCAMKREDPNDKRLIEMVEGGTSGRNEVVLAFADCQQLEAWHTGRQKFLDDFGQYQTLVAAKSMDLKGQEAQLVKQVCDQFRKSGDSLFTNISPTANKEFEKMQEKVRLNETKFLGIYSESDRQCSSSFMQKITAENGQPRTLFGINTTLILNGKVVYFNIYTAYEGEESLTTIRDKQDTTVNDLLTAN